MSESIELEEDGTPLKDHLDLALEYLKTAKYASDKNYYIELAEQQIIMAELYC